MFFSKTSVSKTLAANAIKAAQPAFRVPLKASMASETAIKIAPPFAATISVRRTGVKTLPHLTFNACANVANQTSI